MKFSKKTKISSEIPTASMPDIIFMLLVFFMVTTVLKEYSGLPVNLPKAKRIEKLNIGKADLIVSRALAPLNKLLSYSLLHSNKNTTSLFLKGRNVYNEIEMAKKNFYFNFQTFKSISSKEGCVLKIKNIKTKKKDD